MILYVCQPLLAARAPPSRPSTALRGFGILAGPGFSGGENREHTELVILFSVGFVAFVRVVLKMLKNRSVVLSGILYGIS